MNMKIEDVREMQENKEREMMGVTAEETEKAFEESKALGYSRDGYAASILSDAQEEMALGNSEKARKYINKAKYHLNKANFELELFKKALKEVVDNSSKKSDAELLENGWTVIEKEENINGGGFSVVVAMKKHYCNPNFAKEFAVWTYKGTDTATTFDGDYYGLIKTAVEGYGIRIKREWKNSPHCKDDKHAEAEETLIRG